MPAPNKIEQEIPRLYRRSAFHLLFYGFVNGVIWTTPSISRAEAINAFIKRFKIGDDYLPEDLHSTYCRIDNDFNESQKTKG
jgi:hypothetical protein